MMVDLDIKKVEHWVSKTCLLTQWSYNMSINVYLLSNNINMILDMILYTHVYTSKVSKAGHNANNMVV